MHVVSVAPIDYKAAEIKRSSASMELTNEAFMRLPRRAIRWFGLCF
jgi:hypothetical protein